ncbi:MAG TPA: MBL fold metallo-hydrolase [Vicinamibacterales bacterium]|nr:MBL fold metallo-hydrolase [Vicinamibacterales bacterium]
MITLIPAGNPGPFTGPTGNNTWLVDGAEPLLVDAGAGEPSHLEALARALGGRPLARVFVTHGHRDHAAGVPQLRAAWPELEVIGGAGGAPVIPESWIAAGDGRLEVIATPGHSADHACLWDPGSRALFAGDLLVRGGTVMIAASSGGSLRDYLDSLARVRALDPIRVYPGHGPIIDHPRALIDEYVAHRHAREQQVLETLAHGPSSIDRLVDAIYPGLASSLRAAARETVLAHLRKLDDEGRAGERGGVWSRRG